MADIASEIIKTFGAGVVPMLINSKSAFTDVETVSSGAVIAVVVILLIITILIAYSTYKVTDSGLQTLLCILFGCIYLACAFMYYAYYGYKFKKA